MKVAVCVPLDLNNAGGVENHVLQLTQAIRGLGVQIDLFAHSPGPGFNSIPQLNPDKYHIIHTHGCAFSARFLVLALNRAAHHRHIHTLHGVSVDYLLSCRAWLNWRCYWATFIEGLLSRHADHVIAVSRTIKTRAQQCFALPARNITVIHNGFTLRKPPCQTRSQTRRRLGLAPDDLVLLFVGRARDPVKGAPALTAALNRLSLRYPHLRLLAIPGSGFPDAPWLRRGGNIAHPEMAASYAAADIFVNVSLNEGLPLTVVEALAAPLPIVAAPVGGIPEIITHNHTGLLLQPDRSDLNEQITRLLENPPLRRKLAQNAQNAAQNLTWKKIAQQTLILYKSLL